MSLEYIREYYKVPAEVGREILLQGKRKGVILKAIGAYIGVNFDDMKPGRTLPLHPTDEVEYLGYGKIRPMTASQRRYQKYMELDTGMSFKEFLKYKWYNQ